MPKIDFSQSPNAQMIQSVQSKGVLSANAKTVQDIPLTLIDENPDNDQVFNMDEIERLAENIRQEGFFGTIEVYLKDDGRYEISSGHRRFRAMKMLGGKTIPATVTPMPEFDTKKRRKLIASNINSRNMTPIDWARAIKYHYDTLQLEDEQERSRKGGGTKHYKADTNRLLEVAEYFGLKERTVARYLALNSLIPEMQSLIEQKAIPWTSVSKACKEPVEVQKGIYEQIVEQLSTVKGFEDENGEKTGRGLNGSQVEHIIERYLHEYKYGRPERVLPKEPTAYPISPSIPLATAIEEPKEESIPVTTPESKQPSVPSELPTPTVSVSKRIIDEDILLIRNRIVTLLYGEYEVKDAEVVKSAIKEIKDALNRVD